MDDRLVSCQILVKTLHKLLGEKLPAVVLNHIFEFEVIDHELANPSSYMRCLHDNGCGIVLATQCL